MPALLHFFCHFFTFYTFWHNTLHSQALENFFFLFYVMKNSSHQKINGTTIQHLVPLFFFFSFLHLFHPSIHPSIHPSFHPSTHSQSEPVTKAPSLRLHTPGCLHSAAWSAAAESRLSFQSAFCTRLRAAPDVSLQEPALSRKSNVKIYYRVYICMYIYICTHFFFSWSNPATGTFCCLLFAKHGVRWGKQPGRKEGGDRLLDWWG